MKKILLLITIFISFAFGLTQGKEYQILPSKIQIPNASSSVIELFSYSCIHCYYQFNADILKDIKDVLPKTHLEEWQISQMGIYGKEMNNILAYVSMLDAKKKLNILNKNSYFYNIVKIYYDVYFQKKIRVENKKDFYSFALKFLNQKLDDEITIKDIENYAKNEGKNYIKRSNLGYEIAKIAGTPAFIINGKYLINLEYIYSKEDFLKVVKYLIKKD